MTSKIVFYKVSPGLVSNATTDQNTKLHSLEQHIKDPTIFFNQQQVKPVNESNSRPAQVEDKSRQDITRFFPYCQKIEHTLLYCTTEANDDEIKRQQTRNNQIRRTVFTQEYNKKAEDRILCLTILTITISNTNTGTRIFSSLITELAATQTEHEIQIDKINQLDELTLRPTGQTAGNKLSYSNAKPYTSDSHYNRNFPQSNNLPTPSSV